MRWQGTGSLDTTESASAAPTRSRAKKARAATWACQLGWPHGPRLPLLASEPHTHARID
jgi:hypothetical protein